MSDSALDLARLSSAARSQPAWNRWYPGSWYAAFGKRALDLLIVLLLIPVLMVVLPVLWAAVRADGGRGFFGHRRIGQNGRTFRCWKLRTMVVDADARLAGHLGAHPEAAAEWRQHYKLRDDPRITRLGRFLRKTSLDELPQVWNVLLGEMSFVGPRPIVSAELEYYGDAAGHCFSVRPGVTGLWQVSGRNDVDYPDRVRMDLEYVSNVSLGRDLWILAMTAGAVCSRSGW